MKTLITFVALLLFHTTYSQKIVELWPNEIPNKIKSVEKEVKFYNNDSTLYSFTKVQKPTLEVFLPPKKKSKRVGLIIIPGGGYKNIAYKWEGITTSDYFKSKGIATFILKYRTPRSKSVNISHIAPVQDAQRAIRIIRKNAKKFVRNIIKMNAQKKPANDTCHAKRQQLCHGYGYVPKHIASKI